MITKETLAEHLHYNPATGLIIWRNTGTGRRINGIAGCFENGYWRVKIKGKKLLSHRIAWVLTHGDIDAGLEIDHINGIKTDNRIANLRLVEKVTNTQNRRTRNRNNKAGFLGVHPVRGKFRASIRVEGKLIHLGYFETAGLAHQEYVIAKRRLHPGGTL